MDQTKTGRTKVLTVQVGTAAVSTKSLLRVIEYPWGVEFEVVRVEQE